MASKTCYLKHGRDEGASAIGASRWLGLLPETTVSFHFLKRF
jgi:hypothetical protein